LGTLLGTFFVPQPTIDTRGSELTQPILTQKQLESLTETDEGRRLTDKDGLYGIVRTGKSGVSVLFRWRFRHDGKLQDFNCGTWPRDKLSQVRDSRREAEAVLKTGANPNSQKKLSKLQTIKAEKAELAQLAADAAALRTFESALTDWFASKEISDRKDKGEYLKRAFNKDILPKLGAVALSDLKKGMVMDILLEVAKRAPAMANRTHAGLSQFFAYCIDREWIADNPLRGTKREKIGGKEPPRERILCDPENPKKHELKELQAALPAANLQDSTITAIWIMLGTACRIGELLQARWEHFDPDKREWIIPSDNSKNGQAHVIYLSDFVVKQITTLHEISGESEWCFPAENLKEETPSHVDLKTVTKQIRDRQRNAEPMSGRSKNTTALLLTGGEWTPHDLRRTAATLMGQCGVLSEVIERCLNHTDGNKLKKIYQRNIPRQQMAEAWKLLGSRLELLLSDAENVTFATFGKATAA
jgi:integrase